MEQFLPCLLCQEDLCGTSWILTFALMFCLFHVCAGSFAICSFCDLWKLRTVFVSSSCGKSCRCLFFFLLDFLSKLSRHPLGGSQPWIEQQLNCWKSLYLGYSWLCSPVNNVIGNSEYLLENFKKLTPCTGPLGLKRHRCIICF